MARAHLAQDLDTAVKLSREQGSATPLSGLAAQLMRLHGSRGNSNAIRQLWCRCTGGRPVKIAANLSLLFTELPLIERILAARVAGFDGVEIQFPYEVPAIRLKDQLESAPACRWC